MYEIASSVSAESPTVPGSFVRPRVFATTMMSANVDTPFNWRFPRLLATQPAEPVVAKIAPPPAPAPAPPPPNLDQLLGQYAVETDPDNAFNKLFALWGQRYVAGHVDPCSQALQAGLECLTQRGSLAQLRLFNRPAILNIIDSSGKAHQLVLVGIDEEKARVDLGGGQREWHRRLSRAWFEGYVLL
jgi:general secretion pathway protein A